MIGDLLEGRTKDGPVLVMGWYQRNGEVKFVCISANGTPTALPFEQVSIDWHFDAEKGWKRDFEPEEQQSEG